MSVTLRQSSESIDKSEVISEKNFKKQRREDIKIFIRNVIIISIIFALVIIIPGISTALAVVSCVWALFGPDKAAMSFTLLAFVRFTNPELVLLSSNIGIISWVLLLIVMLRYLPWGFTHVSNRLMPILIFGFVATFLSIVTSLSLDISLLKIISFMIGGLTLISMYNKMTCTEISNVILWVMALSLVVIVFSLFTLTNHNIAYNLNGVGFQGMLNHPQTLGTFLAPVTALVAGRFVFSRNEIFTIELVLALILVVLIMMTQARTAAVSAFLSVVLTVFFVGSGAVNAKIKSSKSIVIKAFGGAMILMLIVVLYQPAQDAMVEFVFKRGSDNIDEALSSRSGGYSGQLDSFMASPIIGHGFGIYPGPVPSKGEVRYFMGIPISAAVEKGFLPTAVLEEIGIIGMFVFIYMIISLTRPVLKNKDPSWLCLYFACLFVNIGEAVFFAVGGMGIFYWQLIALTTVTFKKDEVISK